MKKLITLFIVCFSMYSCENNDAVLEGKNLLLIASKKADCIGVGPQKCFLVKETNQQNWGYFYDSIIGFTHEEGYEYEVLVSEKQIKNPPQDASSIETTLIKIVSKIEKTSENLPN